MPPANSPTGTPLFHPPTEAVLSLLSEAASRPPARARQDEQDADDDNVSFLRTPLPGPDNRPPSPSRSAAAMDNLLLDPRITQSERETVRRLRRYVLQSGRPPAAAGGEPSRRTPPPRSRVESYQGWAPGSTEHDMVEHAPMSIMDLRALARPGGGSSSSARRPEAPEARAGSRALQPIRHMIGSREAERERERERATQAADMEWEPAEGRDASLRTTALLQSVRRHARFSPRLWPAGDGDAAQGGPGTWAPAEGGARRAAAPASSYRHPEHAAPPPARAARGSAEPSKWVEEAIRYLERLRSCDAQRSADEWVQFAEAGGFVRGHVFTHHNQRNDFVVDTSAISPPAPSSWLAAGSVFAGSQKSTSCMTLGLPPLAGPRRARGDAASRRSGGPLGGGGGGAMRSDWLHSVLPTAAAEAGRLAAVGAAAPAAPAAEESWPVRVTITSVDHDNMRLTGTMQAFDVPNKTCPAQRTTIATYLEGEIIDFQRYTLETTSFNATPGVDSTYWRELEPFRSLTDGEMVHNLLSAKWLCEELGRKYVLMRWKEQCFITPSDAQVHLTISGFYYVSLRREDGKLEGLYYDPTSTPYQHLVLKAESRSFPAYEFQGPRLHGGD